MLPEDVKKVWTAFGLNSQAFPIFYSMGPIRFLGSDGEATGVKGATARASRSLSNAPHMLMGLRIANVVNFRSQRGDGGAELFDGDLIAWRVARDIGNEQTVRVNLSQQNVTADAVLQSTVASSDGSHWHPFPAPFPAAGANEIEVEITRASSYPVYPNSEEIIPEVYVTLVAAVLRTDMVTQPAVRRAP